MFTRNPNGSRTKGSATKNDIYIIAGILFLAALINGLAGC